MTRNLHFISIFNDNFFLQISNLEVLSGPVLLHNKIEVSNTGALHIMISFDFVEELAQRLHAHSIVLDSKNLFHHRIRRGIGKDLVIINKLAMHIATRKGPYFNDSFAIIS